MGFKASITRKGAVLLGKYVACDGFEESYPLRVVTHAHADHLIGLQQSLRKCKKVLMTSATKDLIDVMKNPLFLMMGKVKTLEYGETLIYQEETLSFHFCDHILGAAQVLVEDTEGTRILYTGDFKLQKTPVVEADVLVIEATYGCPSRSRPFDVEVEDVLVSLVEEGLQQGVVYIFGYHGKIQEVMQILRKARIKVPFIVPEKVFHVSKVCEKYGMHLGRMILSKEDEGKKLLSSNSPCVAFYHMGSRNKKGKDAFRICVSGWEFQDVCRRTNEREYVVALSDHSDFEGLLEYVRLCQPKEVITDNYRMGDARTLAKEIWRRLKIPAKPFP
jgi:putative mRNA 3-end processing factor